MSRATTILERVEITGGIRVSINPKNRQQIESDLREIRVGRLRWVVDGNDLYVWDGYHAIHKDMCNRLGLDYRSVTFGFIAIDDPKGKWRVSMDTLNWNRYDKDGMGDATHKEFELVQRCVR